MNKKISLVLAIVMIATVFCMAMPMSAAAADDKFVSVDGVEYDILTASAIGIWELATEEVTVKITRDLTQEDFASVSNYLAIFNYETDAEGNPVRVIFDFQGHTVTVSQGNFLRLGAAAGKDPLKKSAVTIKNLNLVQSGNGSFCQVYTGGDFKFENCTFTATNAFAWCGFNANIEADNGDANPCNIEMTNVVINMPASGGTNKVTSFIRTGNFAAGTKDDAGNHIASVSPTIHYVLNNCLLNTTDTISGEDVGNRGIHVTNERSSVVLNNCTVKTVNSCFYPDSTLKNFSAEYMPGNDLIVANDCILDNSGKNPNYSKDVAIYNDQFCTVNDDPLVENGFTEFEMMTPPVVEDTTPETDPVDTPAATEPTVDTPAATEPTVDTPAATDPVVDTPAATDPVVDTPAATTPANTDKPAGGGCGGFTAVATFIALICGAGAAIVIKKK